MFTNRSHNVFGLEHRRRWELMVRSKWSDDITFTIIFISQESYGLFWKSVTNDLFCHFAKRPFCPAAEDRQEQHLGGKQPWSTLSNTSLSVKHSQWALRSTTEWCQDITSWSHMDANMTAALHGPLQQEVKDFSLGLYLVSHNKKSTSHITFTWNAYLQHVHLLPIVLQSKMLHTVESGSVWRWWASLYIKQVTIPRLVSVVCHANVSLKPACFLNWCRTRLITIWSKQADSMNSQSSSLVNPEHEWKFKGGAYCRIASVVFLKTNKGCSLSGEKEVWALVVSYSVSSWSRKMDQFPQLELCLPATINEFVFMPCGST